MLDNIFQLSLGFVPGVQCIAKLELLKEIFHHRRCNLEILSKIRGFITGEIEEY